MSIENKTPTFNSSYDYGPKEEQMVKQSRIFSLFQTIIVYPFKALIYSGSSFLRNRFIDPERVEKAKNQLLAIGGKCVNMKTPDGDLISGMHLSANEFKSRIEKYFTITQENGSKKLFLKEEFCTKEEKIFPDGNTYTCFKPNQEASLFTQQLEGLGCFDVISFHLLSKENHTRGVCISLENIPDAPPP